MWINIIEPLAIEICGKWKIIICANSLNLWAKIYGKFMIIYVKIICEKKQSRSDKKSVSSVERIWRSQTANRKRKNLLNLCNLWEIKLIPCFPWEKNSPWEKTHQLCNPLFLLNTNKKHLFYTFSYYICFILCNTKKKYYLCMIY